MVSEKNLAQRLMRGLENAEHIGELTLISGRRLDASTVTLTADAPPGTFWARTTDESRDAVIVYGTCNRSNVEFVAKKNAEGRWQIRYPKYETAVQQTGGLPDVPFVPPITPINNVNIDGVSFAPLRVQYPTGGGLAVQIKEGFHRGGYFGGGSLDLTSNVPGSAGQVRWVVVGINTATNALVATNGTAFTGVQEDLDITDIQDIALASAVMPLAAVALENGQTAIDSTTWIQDIRLHHAFPKRLDNFAGTTAPTVNDDSADGYAIGSFWFDTTNDILYACLDATAGAAVWRRIYNPFYQTVQEDGSAETQRSILNFADSAAGGIDLTVTDDGGNDRSTVTASLDINALTEDTTPDAEADYLATYDASATATKKVRLDRFPTTERVIFVQTADATVANTTTETTLIGSGRGGVTIAANTATIGTSIHIMVGGYLSDSGNPTLNIKALLDATEVASTGATGLNAATDEGVWIDITITFRTLGATGTVVASGVFEYGDGTQRNLIKTTATTVDTTQDLTINLTATWGTADPGNTITTQTLSIHRFTPPTATYP